MLYPSPWFPSRPSAEGDPHCTAHGIPSPLRWDQGMLHGAKVSKRSQVGIALFLGGTRLPRTEMNPRLLGGAGAAQIKGKQGKIRGWRDGAEPARKLLHGSHGARSTTSPTSAGRTSFGLEEEEEEQGEPRLAAQLQRHRFYTPSTPLPQAELGTSRDLCHFFPKPPCLLQQRARPRKPGRYLKSSPAGV